MEAGWRLPGLVAALKLVLHPLVVMGLALYVFEMPRAWAGVAILFAACPSGINAYLFAQRYGEGIALASSSIALSTGLALVTITVWLQVLGVAG
jgi:predicted permease